MPRRGMLRSVRVGTLGLGLVLVAPACSGDGKPSSGGQPASPTTAVGRTEPAPCALVTPAEVETLLGRPLGSPITDAERCTWSAPDGKGFLSVSVDRDEHARASLDARRATDGGEPVGGIGEAAYVALPGDDLGVVAFVRGPLTVSILVRAPARDRDVLLDLAGAAARRT